MRGASRYTLLSFLVGLQAGTFLKFVKLAPTADTADSSSFCPPSPNSTARARLGDGCYHVFLDVGANIGIHARFLYEPHLYPDSETAVASFARVFGYPRDNRDYCVFAFEPNPSFARRHSDLRAAYGKLGWRYTPIMAGASNVDGKLTFYHTHRQNTTTETGFNAVAPKTLYGDKATSRTVPTIRLASWILNEIQDRQIPARRFGEPRAPAVAMKLDVEGLEYRVFPDLLTSGALCRNVDFLMGEFHDSGENYNYFPLNVTRTQKLWHFKQGRLLKNKLLHVMGISENCKTVIYLKDDESYKIDPHDLPKSNETVHHRDDLATNGKKKPSREILWASRSNAGAEDIRVGLGKHN